jgi:UDP-glucose 4-epimerase
LSLINAIINSSVQRMVFSSSATVYGNEFNPPWNESINIQMPNQPYAQTKFISENILKFFSNNYREISIGILRYFNPIGCHGSGLMGENMKNSTNLVPQIMKTLSGESKFLNIYGNNYNTSDGTGIRDYIHINDLIIGHIKALEFISRKKGFNTWNLGSGKGYSVLEVIRTFENLSGKKIPYRFVSKRDGDIAEYWADISKAKNELDWSCKNGLDDMIKDTLNYINHTANN